MVVSLRSCPLLLPYEEDSRLQSLIAALQNGETTSFQLLGLSGSLSSVVLATLYEATEGQGKHLLILPKEESLSALSDELEALLPKSTFYRLLPATKERSSLLTRTQALSALYEKESAWVLTTSSALLTPVPKSGQAKRPRARLKKGDILDQELFCEKIEDIGFTSCDEVCEPGTYVLRSSRLDIYSYAHMQPLRISFWANRVVRIAFFETESQLSNEEISSVELLAVPDTSLSYSEQVPLLQYLPEKLCLWWMHSSACELPLLDNGSKRPTKDYFSTHLQMFFGGSSRSNYKKLSWESCPQLPQPNLEASASYLKAQQLAGYTLYIAASSHLQGTRLCEVLRTQSSDLQIQLLHIPLQSGFELPEERILCYTDHELTGRTQLSTPSVVRPSTFSLRQLQELQPGDYVVHIDYGIGRFVGFEQLRRNEQTQEMLRLVYKDNDLLYLSVHALHKLVKYSSKESHCPSLSKLGGSEWSTKKSKANRQIKDMAEELVNLYAKRKAIKGYAFPSDSFAEASLVSSFLYEDTADQESATAAVVEDMEAPYPMDRLICGDVGFGKTEIAIRATLKTVRAGKQVAVLVPTTVLALQHYRSFCQRLSSFEVRVEQLHRFRSPKERQQTIEHIATGRTHVLIGTSSLVYGKLHFKDLGLLVIDEEQKFGVRVKEALKVQRAELDVLTLSATPIPRTLHFSLSGLRDISVISTPPAKRQPIHTSLHRFDKKLLQESIHMELARRGQVFFVQNRIEKLPQTAQLLQQLLPSARITIAHGKMSGTELEKSMASFINREKDILLCTNIIENGLDIPNANTILIQDAHLFGLSDLHQMRGRVGRSDRKAFCYLLTPLLSSLSTQATKRLSAVEAFCQLGDGYKIALKDLDIRGAGNLLGAEQSGCIEDLGFETYHKILDEALQEIRANKKWITSTSHQTEPSSLRPRSCAFETDLEAYIPNSYISESSLRMSFYRRLSNLTSTEDLSICRRELEDRFGELSEEVEALLESVRLRIQGTNFGFEKIALKQERLRCFFDPNSEYFNQNDALTCLFDFAQHHSECAKLSEEQKKGCLSISSVSSFTEANSYLQKIFTYKDKKIST